MFKRIAREQKTHRRHKPSDTDAKQDVIPFHFGFSPGEIADKTKNAFSYQDEKTRYHLTSPIWKNHTDALNGAVTDSTRHTLLPPSATLRHTAHGRPALRLCGGLAPTVLSLDTPIWGKLLPLNAVLYKAPRRQAASTRDFDRNVPRRSGGADETTTDTPADYDLPVRIGCISTEWSFVQSNRITRLRKR